MSMTRMLCAMSVCGLLASCEREDDPAPTPDAEVPALDDLEAPESSTGGEDDFGDDYVWPVPPDVPADDEIDRLDGD